MAQKSTHQQLFLENQDLRLGTYYIKSSSIQPSIHSSFYVLGKEGLDKAVSQHLIY